LACFIGRVLVYHIITQAAESVQSPHRLALGQGQQARSEEKGAAVLACNSLAVKVSALVVRPAGQQFPIMPPSVFQWRISLKQKPLLPGLNLYCHLFAPK
jgi:hypothetical protein